MRSICLINFLFFCVLFTKTFAQDSTKISIGVNISNNITNYFLGNYRLNGGFCIEPVVQVKLNKYLRTRIVLGYSKNGINKELVNVSENNHQQLNYFNQGYYVKLGVFSSFSRRSSVFFDAIGLSFSYSNFSQRGDLTIEGKYFGDYKNSINATNQQALFVEPSLDLLVFQHKYFTISSNINFPIPIYRKLTNEIPNYYIPGYGDTPNNQLYRPVWYRFEFYINVPIK